MPRTGLSEKLSETLHLEVRKLSVKQLNTSSHQSFRHHECLIFLHTHRQFQSVWSFFQTKDREYQSPHVSWFSGGMDVPFFPGSDVFLCGQGTSRISHLAARLWLFFYLPWRSKVDLVGKKPSICCWWYMWYPHFGVSSIAFSSWVQIDDVRCWRQVLVFGGFESPTGEKPSVSPLHHDRFTIPSHFPGWYPYGLQQSRRSTPNKQSNQSRGVSKGTWKMSVFEKTATIWVMPPPAATSMPCGLWGDPIRHWSWMVISG